MSLKMPRPTHAFSEALQDLDLKNQSSTSAVRRHSMSAYPLQPSSARATKRPGSAPLTRWRLDPSSYQIREAPAETLKRHQLANHEPPRGVSNRPLSPAVANRRSDAISVSQEWMVSGHKSFQSPPPSHMTIQELIHDSAERYSMLQAAKSTLESADPENAKSRYRRTSFSPRIYSPMNLNSRPSSPVKSDEMVSSSPSMSSDVRKPSDVQKPAITPYKPKDGRANKKNIHHGSVKSEPEERLQTSPNSSLESGHVNAQEATRRRHVEFFESGHSIKQGHLRQLFRTQKAREVAVNRGARWSYTTSICCHCSLNHTACWRNSADLARMRE
eukprot:Tamp_06733.p1 GENE.Tamp_06733~~Tamp_06733.p1  ORF type:complete len:330 (+),score=18.13 Tamp_06733:909-1898(+)